MTKILLSFFFALLTIGTAVTAQTAQVKNTGCANAPYPQMTAAKINQTSVLTFPAIASYEVPILAIGHAIGQNINLGKPLTCVDNCGLYCMPMAIIPFAAGTKSIKIPIPNDPSLFRSCFCAQTAAGTLTGCIRLHGALSFCVGR